ncbi:fungal-specific transcription factor domain-containing protein [Thelonectria olida]|uniref:Fungal-specific transcription factor domain-containing protein n=1 Tax=Thelonectria olida TaxID=1576542 RepID=A0A9P8W0Z9_9HYPO|nr:fungal-specific transcription factor domain-containing protein [Thelonectria olida]
MTDPEQASTIDCYTCKRRRIRCDRTQPKCQKCGKKGLSCPGYGLRLRWVGGKDFRRPTRDAGAIQDSTTLALPALSATNAQLHVDGDWMRTSVLRFLSKDAMNKLVEYYAEHVAGLMVWIDSKDNSYRRYIVPLAYSNPVIGLAMAAISAQHASTFFGDTSLPQKARDEAVGMISMYIRDITKYVMSGHDLGRKLDVKSTEWMLAAMLMLSCYEMTHSGGMVVDFHRRAARSLVNTFETTECERSLLFAFLRNQLSLHDVFACTMSFEASNMHEVIVPDPKDESTLFSTYLAYLHDVTLLSRKLNLSPARQANMGLTFCHVRSQFEVARGETLMTTGRLSLSPGPRRRDFTRLVDTYHQAALLYASRCLEFDIQAQREGILSALFDQFSAMEDMPAWVHNLAWPLFIAGLESHDNPERQETVARLYRETAKKMGFKNFEDALGFMRTFWAGDDADWRALAREWEVEGRPVLPA